MFAFILKSLSVCKVPGLLVLLFSAREALKGAEGRQKSLEAEVERVTQQLKEEMNKVVQQKEEINRMKEELEEHQKRELAEATAREENSRYASNSSSVCALCLFHLFYIPFFLDLIECCWRCRLALHKKMRR